MLAKVRERENLMVEEIRKVVLSESGIPPPEEKNSSILVSSFLNYS